MDFEISTYIKKPDVIITDLDDPNLKEKFINVNNNDLMEQISAEMDHEYIDGYICLKYQEQILLNAVQWDVIDDLWAYILNLIEDTLDHKYAETYFPDQPLLMSFTDQKDHINFELYGGKKKWILPKKQFFNELLDAAEIFFKQMKIYFPQNDYDVELDQIKKLIRKLQKT